MNNNLWYETTEMAYIMVFNLKMLLRQGKQGKLKDKDCHPLEDKDREDNNNYLF